jgi:FKBP-type peptidyl-prolyl cis-trans isomerase FklB
MKRHSTAFFLLIWPLVFSAAQETSNKGIISYAFGMLIAMDMDLSGTGLEFDYDQFTQGFRDIMENRETSITFEEAMRAIDAAFQQINARQMEQRRLEGEKNRAEGDAFLAKNAEKPGIEVTPSGLQYELLSEGTGEKPGPGDSVLVHYEGYLIDGTVFDSSYEYGEPMTIPLDVVIAGWSEGLRMTREGGRVRLYIPPDLAYGENGAGGIIGPNEVIIFEVELLAIVKNSDDEAWYW